MELLQAALRFSVVVLREQRIDLGEFLRGRIARLFGGVRLIH